jgi:outer membrane lipoprotein LolB
MLAGCATNPTAGLTGSDSFIRQGRFAVLAKQQLSETGESVQGGFVWKERAQSLEIDLTSALGNTLARIRVEPTGASLTQADGHVQQAPDADILLQEVLGQTLPVSGLRQWLRGRITSGSVQDIVLDEQGRLTGFTDDAWRVELLRYDGEGPRLLVLKREQAGRIFIVRLIVD